MVGDTIVVAGLARLQGGFSNNTDSQFFKSTDQGAWEEIAQPTKMDQDAMPKDRMAILGDPLESDDVRRGQCGCICMARARRKSDGSRCGTSQMSLMDLLPMEIANYLWDAEVIGCSSSAMVVYLQEAAKEAGRAMVGLNGDYASLELLSAHYDPELDDLWQGRR